MAWVQPKVELGGLELVGAQVAHANPPLMMYGLRRAAPREASVTGFAQVKDLTLIQEKIENQEPVEQSGIFAEGVSVFIVNMDLRHEHAPGEHTASYRIKMMEARLVDGERKGRS